MDDTPLRPGGSKGRHRWLRLALRLTRRLLVIFFLCLGTALLVMSYFVWKNNALVPAILGTALFVFAGVNFVVQGVAGVVRWKRERGRSRSDPAG